MTGFLILAAVVLLIVALAPAHRGARRPWHPGADLASDRDHQRVTDELTAVSQRRPRTTRPRQVARRDPAKASRPSYEVSPTTTVVTFGAVRTSERVRSSGLT